MYLRPGTLDETLTTLAETRGTILAGGTDLFPAFTGSRLSGTVIDISALAELRGIRHEQDYLEIGARTTWTEILHAPLPPGFDGLRAAAREIGSVQIQNQATVAGNICNASPAADGVTALIALEAEIRLASLRGIRSVPLSEFVRGNRKTVRDTDEIVTSIRIPSKWQKAASTFLKLGARHYLVISIVMVAANLLISPDRKIREAAICVGSCSPKALRIREMEKALSGKLADEKIGEIIRKEHFAELSPIDDVRATAKYRLEAAQTLVRRALLECARKAN